MKFSKKITLKEWILVFVVAFVSIGAYTYYILFYTPKNSLELYQAISFADDFEEAQALMLKGNEANFKKKDFEFINRLAQMLMIRGSLKATVSNRLDT